MSVKGIIIFVILAVCVVIVIGKSKTPEVEAVEREAKHAKKYNKYEAEQYVKRCPLGWSRLKNDKCLRLFNNATDHASAELECNAHGSTLASISNEVERSFVQTLILKENDVESNLTSLWIGLRRKVSQLFWYDLTAFQQEGLPWAANQPSNVAGEDCGFIASDHETLVNSTTDYCRIKLTDCTQPKGFVCQKFIIDYCNAN